MVEKVKPYDKDPKFVEWWKKNEDIFLDEYISKNKQEILDHIINHCIKDVVIDCEELCTKFDIFVDTKWEST